MPWDYKRDFQFLANVGAAHLLFSYRRNMYSEHSVNPLNLFFRFQILHPKLDENRQ